MEKINRYNLEIINNISSDRKKLVIENKIEPQLSDRGEWVRWTDIENKLKLLYNPVEPKLEWQPIPFEKPMSWDQADEYAKSLGDGWRLPTVEELKNAYNNKVRGFKPDYYWSSYAQNTSNACFVYFNDGYVYSYSKTSNLYVRCVRDVENKIVKEIEKPKLEWEPNPYKNSMTWEQANAYAKELGEGWRLPTIEELKEAYDNEIEGFKYVLYWSSSECAQDTSSAWYVDFFIGFVYNCNKTDNKYVCCVREVK